MASLSSPFTCQAAKVIFGSIYLHLHLQTVLNLQDLFELKKVDISTDTTLILINLITEGGRGRPPPILNIALNKVIWGHSKLIDFF